MAEGGVGKLTTVEERLLKAVVSDVALVAGDDVPTIWTDPAPTIRAQVLRDILLGRLDPPGPRGVRIHGAHISGQLDLAGLDVPVALHLSRCRLAQPMVLLDARLPQLGLNGSQLAGLEADRLQVQGSLTLVGAEVSGFGSACAVRLLGAQVGGQLSLVDARVRAPEDCALHADGLRLGGDLLLRGTPDGYRAGLARIDGGRGAVRLVGARIGGTLDCDMATITATGGTGLNVERAEIDGNLYLRGSRVTSRASAAVVLVGARVTGQLSCAGARIECAGGSGVIGDDLRVHGDVFVNDGFNATSTGGTALRLLGARIGGHLDHAGGTVSVLGQHAVALDLRFASVGKVLRMPPRFTEWISRTARANGSPGLVALDGLTYPSPPEGPDRAEWTEVLRMHTPSFASQPYQQLAGAYRAVGREDDARRVLIAQQRDLARRGDLGGLSRLRHRLLGVLLGYGYQSWRALLALAGTVALAVAFVMGPARAGHAVTRAPVAGHRPAACSVVEQIGLAVELTVPLIRVGAGCRLVAVRAATEPYVAVGWVFQILGWAFATLFVAGYTGLIRKA